MADSYLYNPVHKRWGEWGNVTPNVEVSEGIRPAQRYIPAPYLPLVRYDEYHRLWYTMSAFTPVTVDSQNFLIPAGLALQFRKAAAAAGTYNFGTGQTDPLTRYTATDVTEGVRNMRGETVVAGEPVIWSIWASNSSKTFGSTENGDTAATSPLVNMNFPCIGLVNQDTYAWYAEIPSGMTVVSARANFYPAEGSPHVSKYHNFVPQLIVGVTTKTFIEAPIVRIATAATADSPVYGGIVRAVELSTPAATKIESGCLIGYDAYSRLKRVNTMKSYYDSGSATALALALDMPGTVNEANLQSAWETFADEWHTVIGQCMFTTPISDYPFDYLDRVRTAYSLSSSFGKLDQQPGSASGGYPANITYSLATANTPANNSAGTCRINIVCNIK